MPRRTPMRPGGLLAVWFFSRAASLRNLQPQDPFSAYDGHDLLQVTACNASALGELRQALDSASCRVLTEPGELVLPREVGCAAAQVTCPPEARLRGHGIELLVEGAAGEAMRRRGAMHLTMPMDHDSQTSLRRQPLPTGSTFYEHFRDYDDIQAHLRNLVNASNGVAKLVELMPFTVHGRRILTVRLVGKRWKPGAPRLIFSYTLHAREWISAMAGVYAVEEALADAAANPEAYAELSITFVPVSNPDGFVYSATSDRFWRKNRARYSGGTGVDLNRNFKFQWAQHVTGPGLVPDVFPGPFPASERETQALQHLTEEAPLSVHLDFHSCGGFILGPWAYTLHDHPRRKEIVELGSAMQKAIFSHEGSTYEFCTGNSCLYPVSGAFSDFSTAVGGLGFTVEMRPLVGRFASYADFIPAPSTILPNAKENYNAVQAAIRWAVKAHGGRARP